MVSNVGGVEDEDFEINQEVWIACSYKDEEENFHFSKWELLAEASEEYKKEASHRQIYYQEIVLDIDRETKEQAKKDYKTIIDLLKSEGYEYKAYFTGSKGFHIHLLFNGLEKLDDDKRKRIKEYFIKEYNCDLAKATTKCLIAWENKPHWKTGKLKTLLEYHKGKNDFNKLIKRYEEKVENDRKEEEIKDIKNNNSNFIFNEDDIPQRIDHSVGFFEINNQKYRYYGVKIFEDIKKEVKGIQTIHKELVNAIVLENGLIVSKNTKPCNFEYISEIGLKDSRWALNSIKSFCKGDYGEISFKLVYEQYKQFYDKSMVFEFEEWYMLNPIWDMCTYYYDFIDKFLIIKHEGDSGSAKSKGMKISSNLSFNGRKFLCPTPANFFRYRHNNKATICIEEAERLFDDSKKSSEQSELVEYLNGSYEKGNFVPRQNDKNINQTDEFDPAGFTRIGSIKGLKGALEKRSIALNMVKASSKDERGNIEIPSSSDFNYEKARNLSYINGLKNYKQYQEALISVKNDYLMSNRQWLLAKPLIAMAHCIDTKIEKKIGKFISKLFSIRDDVIDESSWEIILANCLIETSCRNREVFFISNDDLKSKFSQKVNITEQTHKITSNKISKMMNDLRLRDFAGRNSSGNSRGFELSFFKVSEILIRNEKLRIEDILKKVSEVSDCQIKDDEIKKWYSDNFTDNFKNNKNVRDISDNLTLSEFNKKNVSEQINDINSDNLTLLTNSGRGIPEEDVKEELIWDNKELIWLKCSICGDSPCNKNFLNDKLYCEKHFGE